MPYRSFDISPPRFLAVMDHSRTAAVGAMSSGVLLALAGCAFLPMAYLSVILAGAEVLLSAMGTVFVIAGVTIALLGARMWRARTHLELRREELTIAAAGRRQVVRVRVDDIERVGLDNDAEGNGATYAVQLVVRGGRTIVVGDARTTSRAHHERVAEEIRGFLVC